MDAELLVNRVLDDERLTEGLDEEEAQRLVNWLVQEAENIAAECKSQEEGWKRLDARCRQARAVSRLVELWCYQRDKDAAARLASKERLPWPLPNDPCEALSRLLDHIQ
ncbi:MAG: hypothetical protein KatS3mg105_0015 [Gemmatales bacterium]|nr:MAG: hypothetical protein KatS3mg105_0015 [Gemmatales bacterium]